jgi:hypothetical protein
MREIHLRRVWSPYGNPVLAPNVDEISDLYVCYLLFQEAATNAFININNINCKAWTS